MEIRTLVNTSVAVIVTAFNEAFADYKVKFVVTEEGFLKKFAAEAIKTEGSVGAFDGDRLIGFILNGLDEINGQKVVFNAGTGVIPQYRRQQITEKMYTFILPLLKQQGYRHHQLEVLHDNYTAKRIYERIGFKDIRMVASFKGEVGNYTNATITVNEVDTIDWAVAETFRNVEPTWQNNTQCIQRALDRHRFFAAYNADEFAGYAALDTYNGRMKQFAVKQELRSRGAGRALFSEVAKHGLLQFVNYDMADTASIDFFKSMGLQQHFECYEMKMHY